MGPIFFWGGVKMLVIISTWSCSTVSLIPMLLGVPWSSTLKATFTWVDILPPVGPISCWWPTLLCVAWSNLLSWPVTLPVGWYYAAFDSAWGNSTNQICQTPRSRGIHRVSTLFLLPRTPPYNIAFVVSFCALAQRTIQSLVVQFRKKSCRQ